MHRVRFPGGSWGEWRTGPANLSAAVILEWEDVDFVSLRSSLESGSVPVAWMWKRKIDPEDDDPWITDHDPALSGPVGELTLYCPLYATPVNPSE